MGRDTLTLLQRRFCEEFIIDFCGTQALRRAGSKAQANALAVQANRWLKLPKIVRYVEHLQGKVAKDAGVTAQSYVHDIISIRDEARHAEQYSAAVKAHELLGRTTGMLNRDGKKEVEGSLAAAMTQVNVMIKTVERVEVERPVPSSPTAIEIGTEFDRPIEGLPGETLSSNDDGTYRVPPSEIRMEGEEDGQAEEEQAS